jgi:hypothetical protein
VGEQSMFTMVLSSEGLSPGGAASSSTVARQCTPQAPLASSSLARTDGNPPSLDLALPLASFRERCHQRKAALLPRPLPKRPRQKRAPPSTVHRSRRVAGRFAPRTPVSRQQKALMLQLGLAREGEVMKNLRLGCYP